MGCFSPCEPKSENKVGDTRPHMHTLTHTYICSFKIFFCSKMKHKSNNKHKYMFDIPITQYKHEKFLLYVWLFSLVGKVYLYGFPQIAIRDTISFHHFYRKSYISLFVSKSRHYMSPYLYQTLSQL